ncbi:hypothetical protein [Phenylobacterium sp.]|uniref:hypothetical protein n=1 Tax=Phenylobacterium sp. TaxID=1871053 RepID=UPI0027262132|nr:hypothetical protein [Phenylobacterium sp.]MDO8378125.1 hypothetical protein [Phenylobacterium sp.]
MSKGPWREAWNAAFPVRRARSAQQLSLLYGFGFGVGLTAGCAMMLMAFGLGVGVGILAGV